MLGAASPPLALLVTTSARSSSSQPSEFSSPMSRSAALLASKVRPSQELSSTRARQMPHETGGRIGFGFKARGRLGLR
eukprot:scaffold98323_cov69-Phaeocystis_antarctica.AAC.3